jgi:hypothetical protein
MVRPDGSGHHHRGAAGSASSTGPTGLRRDLGAVTVGWGATWVGRCSECRVPRGGRRTIAPVTNVLFDPIPVDPLPVRGPTEAGVAVVTVCGRITRSGARPQAANRSGARVDER